MNKTKNKPFFYKSHTRTGYGKIGNVAIYMGLADKNMKKEKITFELARDMNLLPPMTKRYYGWFPFMSAYGVEKRDEEQNNAYKAELEVIKLDYCDKNMLVNVELDDSGFPIRALPLTP